MEIFSFFSNKIKLEKKSVFAPPHPRSLSHITHLSPIEKNEGKGVGGAEQQQQNQNQKIKPPTLIVLFWWENKKHKSVKLFEHN